MSGYLGAASRGRPVRCWSSLRAPKRRTQARYCAYARSALALVPDARAIVVWNEANSRTYWNGTPSEYEALLARCYDTLHRTGLTVLDSTASAHAPEAFLRAVGAAYRASGRTRPLVDAFGHNPYPASWSEPPNVMHRPGFVGEGDYARLVRVLEAAFGRAPKIWYLEDGFQSTVPLPLRGRYNGRETVRTLTPAQHARELGDAIRLAACQPDVRRRRDTARRLAVGPHLARRAPQTGSGRVQGCGAASRLRLSIDSASCAGSVGSPREPARPTSSD